MLWLGHGWVQSNNLFIATTLRIQWDLPSLNHLSLHDWYFVISNHQSWTDILVIQKIFVGKIPFIRFFIKKPLLWLPILNIAWFAFNFPIMHRFSKKQLMEHPEWRNKDLETTKKSCEKFKTLPVTLLSFLEGTRFTKEKHQFQHSPYQHLLLPKAGGFAFAIYAMDRKIKKILDVTIIYPNIQPTFWDFLSGKIHHIIVKIHEREIPSSLLCGSYSEDEHYRQAFKNWITGIWEEKDRLLSSYYIKKKSE